MFYAIDDQDKLQWLLNGLESGDIVVGRTTEETKEEREQFSRELAEYRAAHAMECAPVSTRRVAYA